MKNFLSKNPPDPARLSGANRETLFSSKLTTGPGCFVLSADDQLQGGIHESDLVGLLATRADHQAGIAGEELETDGLEICLAKYLADQGATGAGPGLADWRGIHAVSLSALSSARKKVSSIIRGTMKTKRIVAKTIETAFGENPNWTALVASSDDETVEVIFETMQAPAIAAGILLSSQDAVKKLSPGVTADGLARNLERSMKVLPEAVDISLAADGDVLCINVGSGAIFLKLTDTAKQALKNCAATRQPLDI